MIIIIFTNMIIFIFTNMIILLFPDICGDNIYNYRYLLIYCYFQIFVVIIFIMAVIMYRVLVSIPLFENKNLRSKASMIASMTAAVVNLIIIMALGRVYEKLALKFTQWGKIDNLYCLSWL